MKRAWKVKKTQRYEEYFWHSRRFAFYIFCKSIAKSGQIGNTSLKKIILKSLVRFILQIFKIKIIVKKVATNNCRVVNFYPALNFRPRYTLLLYYLKLRSLREAEIIL